MIWNLAKLDSMIKLKMISGIYFFYGEDTYEAERYISKIKGCFNNLSYGINYFTIDKTNIDSLYDICVGSSFLGDEKLVIVKDSKLKFNMNILDDISKIQGVTVIIVENKIDKRLSEYKQIQKIANTVEFCFLKPAEASLYIQKLLSKYQIYVDSAVADYMIEVCTVDKQFLVNECRKIVAYLDPGDTLTCDIIDRICVRTLDAKIFDVIDNIVAKKKDVAFNEIDDLISQKVYVGLIASMIFKRLKQLYKLKLIEEDIHKSNIKVDIASKIDVTPFILNKLMKIKDMYSIEKLEELMIEFADYDVNFKIGLDDSILGLKRIVAIMCATNYRTILPQIAE